MQKQSKLTFAPITIILAKKPMTREIILILPDIRSCWNVGAMFRTADGLGVSKVYLAGYTPAPPNPRIAKVALGAETWLPWEQAPDLNSLLTKLKQEGWQIVALEKTAASTDISQTSFGAKVALLVGNEVEGVPADSQALADNIVHIPMLGLKGSLNVAIATSIALYQIRHGLQTN
ncbi:MAG: TrmH family RNA methyltransferase [Candidatus Falkowbacteria bacterium]